MLGLFATKAVNPAVQVDGLFIGGSVEFFLKEVISVVAICIYCFVFTYIMLKVINLITPVKVTQEEEIAGLDSSLHGEMAYEED
jgi:Amt family ammonium transporter